MFQDERSEECLLLAPRRRLGGVRVRGARRRELPRGFGRVVMRGRERREAVPRREQRDRREKARQRERQLPREPRRLGGRGRAERILIRARDGRVPRRLGTRSEESASLGLDPSASPSLRHLDGPRGRMCPKRRAPRTRARSALDELEGDETVARSRNRRASRDTLPKQGARARERWAEGLRLVAGFGIFVRPGGLIGHRGPCRSTRRCRRSTGEIGLGCYAVNKGE